MEEIGNTSLLQPLPLHLLPIFIPATVSPELDIGGSSILATTALTAFLGAICLSVYWIFVPANVKRNCSNVKLDSLSRGAKAPPAYPNGWIPIAETNDVKFNCIHRASVHIHQVILARSEEGDVYCYDAYCPHLGANLGMGGEVNSIKGSTCITCPFHSWSYEIKTGKCLQVPYSASQKAPNGVKLKKWPCIELSGLICVWYHAEREEPDWYPPPIPEIESGEWTYGGRNEHIINCHLQEVPENVADDNHFQFLHSSSAFVSSFGKNWRRPIVSFILGKHEWGGGWKGPDADGPKHISHHEHSQTFKLFGFSLFTTHFKGLQIGPCINYTFFQSPDLNAKGVLIQRFIALDTNKSIYINLAFTKQDLKGRFLSRMFMWGEANTLDRDCYIWQHKKYVPKPNLLKEDKAISAFRKFYSQFYSANSPKNFKPVLDW